MESMAGAAAGCETKTELSVGAVNVRSDIALVARSEIAPPLRSSVVLIEIPSVSNSSGSSATVYLKRAVRESTID
jgi:hypothetical protein